jgi:CBS domain-containing protein
MFDEAITAPLVRRPTEKRHRLRARDQSVRVLKTDLQVSVSPQTPLGQVIEVMKREEGGCVIISQDGRVAGIFTERDLLTKIVGERVNLDEPVNLWMSPLVETLTPEATIGDAVRVMNEKGYRHIPLVEGGMLVGSISVFGVITYLAECFPQATMNLPPFPAQVMARPEGG